MRPTVSAPVHLAQHVEHLKAAGQSPKTIQARIEVITRLELCLRGALLDATTEQLATWLARSGWSRATRQIYRYHIRAYYGWLEGAGLIKGNPARALTRVQVPRAVPRPVTDQVLRHILTRARDPYVRYFTLAAYAGLRCQEIALLRREDVTEDEITVHGKGDKTRIVPTHAVIWARIGPMPPGLVSHLSPTLSPQAAAARMSAYSSRVLTLLGHQDVTMHRLRHWFGTTAYRQTRNLRAVQELLGHATIATTERYTQVSGEERRSAIDTLPAVA